MKMKKYTAPSMPEAMKMIRTELGEHAVILHAKTVYSGGFLGLFKKKNIEVVAGIDTLDPPIQRVKDKRLYRGDNEKTLRVLRTEEASPRIISLEQEMKELKKRIEPLSNKNSIPLTSFPEELKETIIYLKRQGLEKILLLPLAKHLLEQWRKTDTDFNADKAWQFSQKWLEDIIKPFHLNNTPFAKKYISVVGPTGVGKTTTLAKLAATAVLEHQKKVAFITTDTYRVAAIEQLKTYANLLNVPVEVVHKLSDFQLALEKFEEYDHVFIDTAGRNFREQAYVKELEKLVDFQNGIETYLVLALTAKQEDLEEIIENFSVLPIEKFIFTKLDETKSPGPMINLVIKYQKGIAYMTNGQNVPDDLIKANEKTIITTLFGANLS